MTRSKLAQWALFHRMYVTSINAFMSKCPIVFRDEIEDLGMVTCEIVFRRRKYAAFEIPDELHRPALIREEDASLFRANKNAVLMLLYKCSTVYESTIDRPLTELEARMLAEWLGIQSLGRYVTIDFNRRIE